MDGRKKRDRATNFTKIEVRLLIQIIGKYRNIIENKRTDTTANEEKIAAWKKITHMFNTSTRAGNIRSTKTLKLKYDSIKKTAKKKVRQQWFKTGAGPDAKPILDDIEEKVVSMSSSFAAPSPRTCSQKVQEYPVTEQLTNSIEDRQKNIDQDSQDELKSDNEDESEIEIHNENIWTSSAKPDLQSTYSKLCKKIGVTREIDDLTVARKQLMQLKMEIARKEHEFIRREHEIKMLHLANEEKRKQEMHNMLLKKMNDTE